MMHACVGRSLLFTRRGDTESANIDAASAVPGWKLFGKIPPKLAPEKHTSDAVRDHQHARTSSGSGPLERESTMKLTSSSAFVRGQVARRSDKEVPSTTALILEHRPELVVLYSLLLLLPLLSLLTV